MAQRIINVYTNISISCKLVCGQAFASTS